MINAYFTVEKHKLFDCKSAVSIKLLAQVDNAKRNALILKMS